MGHIRQIPQSSSILEAANTIVTSEPFRPIQYLGSKLRVIKQICSATTELVGESGTVADLFSGSTVVAQSLASRGYKVSAVDVELYSNIFAQALLGIGKRESAELSMDMLENPNTFEVFGEASTHWAELAEAEALLIRDADGTALSDFYDTLPLAWTDPQNAHYGRVSTPDQESAFGRAPLLTILYSGRYFGVEQTLLMDQYIHSIQNLWARGRISEWERAAYLTAVMHAASKAVHSAGKHFAQPLNGKKTGDRQFGHKRLMEDRRVSIRTAVSDCLSAINQIAYQDSPRHHSYHMSAEQFCSEPPLKADMFYLDPPYTAQQYSRFYHILNVICTYRFPHVVVDGLITQGIYGADRYKSAFSSRRSALPTLTGIIENANQNRTALLISYSDSAAGSDGNARMISLEDLLDACRRNYGNARVDVRSTKHAYRQFNSSTNANVARNDPEVLILCKAH